MRRACTCKHRTIQSLIHEANSTHTVKNGSTGGGEQSIVQVALASIYAYTRQVHKVGGVPDGAPPHCQPRSAALSRARGSAVYEMPAGVASIVLVIFLSPLSTLTCTAPGP